MIEERNAQGSRAARTKEDLANELRELAERHGLSYGRAAEIMSQLENGAAHPVTGVKTEPPGLNGAVAAGEAPSLNGALELSDNARVILEKRYLMRDEQGDPAEGPEELFHRVAGAVARGEAEAVRSHWETR